MPGKWGGAHWAHPLDPPMKTRMPGKWPMMYHILLAINGIVLVAIYPVLGIVYYSRISQLYQYDQSRWGRYVAKHVEVADPEILEKGEQNK